MLDIDPIDLAKGKLGSRSGGLFDYVNDRPYASTSFMSTAIVKVFNTAVSGRCTYNQELADTPHLFTATLSAIKDNRAEDLAAQLFEPLGYTVEKKRTELDGKFPEWGASPYIDLTIRGTVKLCDLLNHIYVLIPVFDRQKHYYISRDEIQKLLDHGAGWLAGHPYREKIVQRYFRQRKYYAQKALELLRAEDEEESVDEAAADELETEEEKEERTPLNTQRLETVKRTVLESGAASVIDMGCGEGRLAGMLLKERQIRKLTACDVSVSVLERAAEKLRQDRLPLTLKNKLTLMQASLTYRDRRFSGYDCACIVEVMEHIEPARIPAFERVVFEYAAPKTVIVTTPNREYNVNYQNMKPGTLRHGDHRFEWTRAEFKAWADNVCRQFGYRCEISGIGEENAATGSPTQMGVFTKNG